jgi:hypothetical protein
MEVALACGVDGHVALKMMKKSTAAKQTEGGRRKEEGGRRGSTDCVCSAFVLGSDRPAGRLCSAGSEIAGGVS